MAADTAPARRPRAQEPLLEHHGEVPVTLELDLSEGSITLAPSGNFKAAYGRDLAFAVERPSWARPPPRAPHRARRR